MLMLSCKFNIYPPPPSPIIFFKFNTRKDRKRRFYILILYMHHFIMQVILTKNYFLLCLQIETISEFCIVIFFFIQTQINFSFQIYLESSRSFEHFLGVNHMTCFRYCSLKVSVKGRWLPFERCDFAPSRQ